MAVELRPATLDDIIGNEKIKLRINISLVAAQKENRPFPHVLFQGSSGCGKTTFARALANAQNGHFYEVNSGSIKTSVDLLNYFTRLKRNDVLFIDEIHSLEKSHEEFCYPFMEDFQYTTNIEDISLLNQLNITEEESKTISKFLRIDIPPFTMIGATTDVGNISGPLKGRFKIDCQLTPYSIEDIQKILIRNSKLLSISLTSAALQNLSKRCKEIPRIANSILEGIRDFSVYKNKTDLDEKDINEALGIADIDEEGWDTQDRIYLQAVEDNQPVGIQSIAAATGFTQETIRKVIEPPMLRKGKIKVTTGGRVTSDFSTRWTNTLGSIEDSIEL